MLLSSKMGPKGGTPPKEQSSEYGTLHNEGDEDSTKPNINSLKLNLFLAIMATSLAVAVIVILAVYRLSLENENRILVGNSTESGNARLASNLTDQERVLAVLARVPLIDGHSDFFELLTKRIGNKLDDIDFTHNMSAQWGFSQTDIPRMHQGMLGAQLWAVVVPCSSQQTDALRLTLEMLDTIKRFLTQYNDTLALVTDSQGILESFENGRISSLISIEGGHSIDSSLAALRMLYELGVRSMGLTHNCNTSWSGTGGQLPQEENGTSPDIAPTSDGLTDFGETVVKEMNRLGMIIDLSHASEDTILDTLNVTTAPVIFSHTAAWHLCNGSNGNLNDDILHRVHDNNGIVMVSFTTASLDCTLGNLGTPTVSTVADHVEWIKQMTGPDHVGIGATFESGIYYTPDRRDIGLLNPMDMEGLQDVSHYPNVFTELASRGWTDEDLEKLAGRNFLRVFSEVEQERDRLQSMMGPIEDLVPEADVSDLPCRSDL